MHRHLLVLCSLCVVNPCFAQQKGIVNNSSSPNVKLKSVDIGDCQWTALVDRIASSRLREGRTFERPGRAFLLTAEGEARKAAHEFLLGPFAVGKQSKFKGEGATRVLDEIVISTQRQELNGDVMLELPAGTQRVASMFRYFILRGEGLDQLEGIEMHPYAAGSALAISTRQDGIYRVKVAAMPIPADSMPPIVLKTRCKPGTTAVVTEIALNSQAKLSATFDDIPYRNLGEQFPRESVDINIDVTAELSIDGHIDLEREKFCRYYAAPGNVHESFEQWAAARNFLPGRQIKKLQPALVAGYSKNQPRLTEDESRPGAADLSFFDRFDSSPGAAIPEFRDIRYAMCLNDYPDFMSIEQVGRGTPLVEHFDDAAELAAAYVADEIKDGGRTATWWEVKNESTIKSEWDYHWRKDADSWKLMADFHNRVADAIHEKSPNILVGGPSSAWMQLQAADFGLYRNQTKFMDLTKDHVDFYSHHFYEDTGTLGAWERRQGKYTNYLLGRLEATLDMFAAHMHATNNRKPILITECGSLQAGRGPSDYWLRIRSYSAYMHKLMCRPQQIELVVPFAFLSIPWNPQSGDAAFIPKDGKPSNSLLSDCEPTPVARLFDLWRDFDGRRLPVSVHRDWLDVTAVHEGSQIQLAITNMGGRRLSLNISGVTNDLPIASVAQRRLYYHDGEVVYEDSIEHSDASAIPVDSEETTIVTIELKEPLSVDSTATQKHWYAAETAIKVMDDDEVEFAIAVEYPRIMACATLIIGVQRDGGLNEPLRGTINGHSFQADKAWPKEFKQLFAPIKISLPLKHLKEANNISVRAPKGTTITSVQIVTTSNQE